MKRSHSIPRLLLALAIAGAAFLVARPARAAEGGVLDPDAWPRSYKVGTSELAIYMPQILEWSEFRHLKANAAIGLKLEGATEITFGAAAIEADTVVDRERRTVMIGKRTISGFRFPELDAANAAKAEALVRSVLKPDSPLDVPLDAMTAAVDRASANTGDTAVSFDPPPIYFSESPAVLVVFIGEPKLESVSKDDPSLMFGVNTNWDVLFDSKDYYLLAGNQWLTTKDLLKGPWTGTTKLPESFQKLPDNGNWSEVKAKLQIAPAAVPPPGVFVSNRPAEIILTEGELQLSPISGTGLMYVANTTSDLFYHLGEKKFYFLTSGRWFGAPAPKGPWSAATQTLPEDFAKIPGDHPKANVLVSVKGTAPADEAVILASIPQTASVDRATAKIEVVYDGEPQFKPIPGAKGVEYAINTSYDVFGVSPKYYCCHQGVWFEAPAATGAWVVCDKVPDPIYTIPPESPKHNVTYVYVYESTPQTVQVGTTSGYSGSYVANGLVVFGLGLWIGHEIAENNYWHGHYYPQPYWYGYGCGAAYHPANGYYRRGAACYGPYGGAGYGAAYNPRTGTYARGAYAYGPYGAAGAKAAYNPWTNTAAGRVGASTPYGSWGRSAVVRGDDWVRAGHRSNAYGTVGGIQTSGGGGAIGVDRKYGSDGFVGKTGNGDVYVGRDGNIYKKDADGGWQQRQNGGWQNAPNVSRTSPYASKTGAQGRPTTPGTRPTNPGTRPTNPGTRPTNPGTRPTTPGTRPTTPGTRPTTPGTRPTTPGTRPTTPGTRPTTPSTRPTTPSTRPTQSSSRGYTNRQSTPSQLSRDSYSRQRSSSRSSSRTSSSRSFSRGSSGGGRRR